MSAPAPPADPWFTERWAGEVRVNLIRLVALLAFFSIHIVRSLRISNPPADEMSFQLISAAVALGWGGLVAIVYAILRRHQLPPHLPIITVATDAVLATIAIAAAGPQTPLLIL